MLMKSFRPIHLLLLALAAVLCPAGSFAADWETVKTEIRDARRVTKEYDVEILTTPGCIIVSSGRQLDIKVFTILGRVVSEETLQPGVSRLKVAAHGVYIVKAGELTCKVAI